MSAFLRQPQPQQLTLGIDTELVDVCKITDGKIVNGYTKKAGVKKSDHPGRRPIPDHIRRVIIELKSENLPAGAVKIGEERTDQLEFDPVEFMQTFISVPNTR